MIYTGNRKNRPQQMTLSEEFFQGEKTAVEVAINVIYDGKEGDIINQYVTFTKILNEQIRLYGRTKEAILETIRICRYKDVLKEYLESKESEVVDIMMQLYDQEEIMRVHDIGVARESAIRTAVEIWQESGATFLATVDKVAQKFSISHEVAEEEVSEYWQE